MNKFDAMLNTVEAGAFLNVKPGTMAAWRFRGVGPQFIRLEGQIFYRKSILERYLRDSVVVTSGRPNPRVRNRWSGREALSA